MTEHTKEEKGIKVILKYWPVVAFLFSLGVVYATLNNAQANTVQRVNGLETRIATVDASQNTIMVQLSQIQTDLAWIKQNIKK